MAPTVIPTDITGNATMYYQPRQILRGSVKSYHVQLSSPHHELSSFSGVHFTSAALAALGVTTNPFAQSGPGETPVTSKVSLGSGLTGTATVVHVAKPSATAIQSASVRWQEGRWHLTVQYSQSVYLPTAIAFSKRLVAALQHNFLPVPQSHGAVRVFLTPQPTLTGTPSGQPQVQVQVVWQAGDANYQVQTYTYCQNPVSTAVKMAASMRPYSS